MLAFYMSLIESEEDRGLFERLYNEHERTLYNHAYNILKDPQLAEDAVNDAFLSLAKNMKKLSGQNCIQMRNYLIIIVKHASYKIYNDRKYEYPTEILEAIDEDLSNIMIDIEDKDVQERLFNLIKSLDPKYSEVLIFKYKYYFKDKEIAKQLGITLENVKIRLVRGKAKLKDLLEGNML